MNVEQIDTPCKRSLKLRDLKRGQLFKWAVEAGMEKSGIAMRISDSDGRLGYCYLSGACPGFAYTNCNENSDITLVYQAEPLKYKLAE